MERVRCAPFCAGEVAMRRPHFSSDDRPFDLEDHASPGVLRLYLIAIGVTILLGLITGSIWIGWNLFRIHVLR